MKYDVSNTSHKKGSTITTTDWEKWIFQEKRCRISYTTSPLFLTTITPTSAITLCPISLKSENPDKKHYDFLWMNWIFIQRNQKLHRIEANQLLIKRNEHFLSAKKRVTLIFSAIAQVISCNELGSFLVWISALTSIFWVLTWKRRNKGDT